MKSKSLPASGPKMIGHSTLGAPSQHTQASRKGKRSWRKNVDIEDIEEGLEGLRAEERITGYADDLDQIEPVHRNSLSILGQLCKRKETTNSSRSM